MYVQDAHEDVEHIVTGCTHSEHHNLDSDLADATNCGTTQRRTEPLDADPLMRAAAELLAENASLLTQRGGGMA